MINLDVRESLGNYNSDKIDCNKSSYKSDTLSVSSSDNVCMNDSVSDNKSLSDGNHDKNLRKSDAKNNQVPLVPATPPQTLRRSARTPKPRQTL